MLEHYDYIVGISASGEIRNFNVATDIYSITIEKKIPVLNTIDGPFYILTTLDTLGKWLDVYGYKPLDTVNLVNINLIEAIDPKTLHISFLGKPKHFTTAIIKRVRNYDLEHLIKED